MSKTRMAIWAFWIFIIGMMIWEFYSYNQDLTQQAHDHPADGHFFFYHKDPKAVPKPEQMEHNGPFLTQTGFTVEPGVPNYASFTCHVTVKNIGTAKATNIQVCVRPFKGIKVGDEDLSNKPLQTLPDSDPTSLIDQWVTLPDLAPGQSASQSAVFYNKPGFNPGRNPDPLMRFEAEKAPKRPRNAVVE